MWKCQHCSEQLEDNFDSCWNCGYSRDGIAPVAEVENEVKVKIGEYEITTVREKDGQFLGVGCLIQGFGLLTPIIFYEFLGVPGAFLGLILFVILFIVGSKKANTWRCGNCKNPIFDEHVRICPVCKAQLTTN